MNFYDKLKKSIKIEYFVISLLLFSVGAIMIPLYYVFNENKLISLISTPLMISPFIYFFWYLIINFLFQIRDDNFNLNDTKKIVFFQNLEINNHILRSISHFSFQLFYVTFIAVLAYSAYILVYNSLDQAFNIVLNYFHFIAPPLISFALAFEIVATYFGSNALKK